MNIQVQPGISGAALPCSLFTAGDFVRTNDGEVGQVVRGTSDKHSLTILLLENRPEVEIGSGQGYADYEPGCLTMWTPGIVVPVAAPVPLPSLDLEKVNELLMKIVSYSNLANDLGNLEMNNEKRESDDLLPSHINLIGNAIDDAACDLLDMIENEERRIRQAA
jgi:hypothetical protein